MVLSILNFGIRLIGLRIIKSDLYNENGGFRMSTSSASQIPVEMDAPQLAAMYEMNEMAADNALKGNPVKVTGIVATISKDISNNPCVVLVSGRRITNVECVLVRSAAKYAALLTPGMQVTIQGEVNGKLRNVVLGKCIFTSVPSEVVTAAERE